MHGTSEVNALHIIDHLEVVSDRLCPSMTDPLDRLKAVLADRYTIEHELGAGGMARQAVRRYGG